MRPTFRPHVDALEGRQLLSSGGQVRALVDSAQGSTTLTTDPSPPANRREVARRHFAASFVGSVAVGLPRTVDESRGFRIVGGGKSNKFLHGTLQLNYFTPSEASGKVIGAATLTDRNTANGSSLLVDVTGNSEDVDPFGRPTHLVWTVANNSGGAFSNSTGQGTINIHYSGRKALVVFEGQVITTGVGDPTITA